MKATAEAAPNIAFIKYWGARDLAAGVPLNPSLSMTLDRCRARTTVEELAGAADDRVELAGADGGLAAAGDEFAAGVRRHLTALRAWAGSDRRFRVATRNNFPTGAGIASSAAGFAALATAFVAAVGRRAEAAELSRLARASGSGSAARSVLGGFVRWPAAGGDDEAPAEQLAPAEHWPLCDLIVVVDSGEKAVSSREGHRRAPTSPYFERRQAALVERLRQAEQAVAARDLERLGPVLEEEAVDLHLIAMSSRPPIFYWRPESLTVIEAVRDLRRRGLGVWFTMDAGPNVHVLCEPRDEPEAAAAFESLRPAVERVVRDRVGAGPVLLEEALF